MNTKFRDAKRIQQHAAAGLREIHAAAPNAAVVLVGYPRLLPDHGTCGAAPFAKGDYAFANRVEHLLNRSLKRAAAHHHATFVSMSGVSKGHDICAGKAAWINGVELRVQRGPGLPPLRGGGAGDRAARVLEAQGSCGADERRRRAARRRDPVQSAACADPAPVAVVHLTPDGRSG